MNRLRTGPQERTTGKPNKDHRWTDRPRGCIGLPDLRSVPLSPELHVYLVECNLILFPFLCLWCAHMWVHMHVEDWT